MKSPRPALVPALTVGLFAFLAGCGLEANQGAIGAVESDATATPAQVVRPGTPVSTSPEDGWQAFQLGPDVVTWLPIGGSWELIEQGSIPGGAAHVQLADPTSGVGILAQAIVAGADISAPALCAAALSDLLAARGVEEAVPEPIGNPVPDSPAVAAFSCAVEAADPRGPRRLHLDVVLRPGDGVSYLQQTDSPAADHESDAVAAALATSTEMLLRTVARLEQP